MDKTTLPTVALFFSEGSSDKEYRAQIVAKDDSFIVNFQYGRRGASLTSGSKTPSPIPFDKALKDFEKLVQDKKCKGYTEEDSGAAFTSSANAGRVTGLLPHLLNPIGESDLPFYIQDASWGFQEKKDGKRMMLSRTPDGVVIPANRRGLEYAIPQCIVDSVLALPASQFELDGEQIGDRYYVFDILSLNGHNLRSVSFMDRYRVYRALPFVGSVQMIALATDSAAKQILLKAVKESNEEGIVAKLLSAPYVPGRAISGGTQLKFKFTESASCLVLQVNGTKRSVSLGLFDDAGDIVIVGNVTVPPNLLIPQPGLIAEVRYMHLFDQGSLYQPVLQSIRDDIESSDCKLTQVTRIKAKFSELDD